MNITTEKELKNIFEKYEFHLVGFDIINGCARAKVESIKRDNPFTKEELSEIVNSIGCVCIEVELSNSSFCWELFYTTVAD